jgi:dicarboxylate/amino acid:cation (Na+ or H+) symporter, DAACS family
MSGTTAKRGKGLPLHTRILVGLVVGAVLGLALKLTLGVEHGVVEWLNRYVAGPLGQIFLRLLFMVVVPLVFASISLGVASLGDLKRVGRIGLKTLAFFLLTMLISVTIGLTMVQLLRPGTRITPETRAELMATYASDATSKVVASRTATFGVETLVGVIPRNPVAAAANLDLLGIIFFGIIFGVALTMITPERARPMVGVLEALNDVVIKIVEMAMKLAPYGVAALIFGVTSRFGWALLQPLAVYMTVVLAALAVHTLVSFPLILRLVVGLSPLKFFSRVKAPLITALSTSSSSATLPTSIATAEQNLGVPSKVAGFVLPLGATMNMNGTALFEGVTVIFLAQAFGVTLDLGQQVVILLMAVITALGAAGVPGGSIPLLVGILAMFGVPGEGIALILGVDRLLDMARTVVNVAGDLVATTFIAKSEGLWSAETVPAAGVEAGAGALDESPSWPGPDDVHPTHEK